MKNFQKQHWHSGEIVYRLNQKQKFIVILKATIESKIMWQCIYHGILDHL